MRKKRFFLFAFVLIFISSCANSSGSAKSPDILYTSYLDVPGITADEISEIQKLQQEVGSFTYGMPFTSEAFYNNDGRIEGFAALFCDWMSRLFGIPFKPVICEWGDLLAGLDSGQIDFTGEMRATDERRATYYMTDAIAERSLSYYRLADSEPLEDIQKIRPLRYAFLKGASTAATITANLKPGTYEVILLDSIGEVYGMLKDGEIDAFFYSNVAEAAFYTYNDMTAKTFFPLIYSPVSLTTQNVKYKVIIDVVQKILQNNGLRSLTSMYNLGRREYMKYMLNTLLTEDERVYIKNHPIIKYAAENRNYPVCFYNTHEKEYQGITIDLLNEIELFTGLTFEVTDKQDTGTEFQSQLQMLENSDVSFITELIYSEDRQGRFLWPKAVNMTEHIALLSKSGLENVKLNEILYTTVGVGKNTVYEELFKQWFPTHRHTVTYDSTALALDALERGEIDTVMASLHQLLILTHYQGLPGYKANYIFESTFDSKFGFNKNEAVLCSVMDKALSLVNTASIADMWTRRTYDYRLQLVQAQLPWFIGASVLSLCVLFLIITLFVKSRRTGRQLESLVAERTSELRLASQAKTVFLANISHELRTPLNVVIGLTNLILEENHLPWHVSENLQKIGNAGSTLLSIVNELLDISKIESGKLVLTPVEYHVASILNDVITLANIRLSEKPVSFRLSIGDNLPARLYGDDLRVKQIFNNLLSNAVKYTNEGSIELRVDCACENNKDVWMDITVTDSGIGIREDDLKKLFHEYNQVDTQVNRQIEGTGLGLAITKKIAEMLDGEISAESVYGKGSVFRVRIRQGFVDSSPIGPVIAENLRNFRYTEDKNNVKKKLARLNLSYARVLVVDDMQTNLDLAAGLMGKYGMQVDCVTGGHAAVELIRRGEPVYDAVFMDHMMPEMDGIEACETIRKIGTEYARKVPIVVLTANAIHGTEEMFYKHGFQAYLSKPIDILELDSVIRKWVSDGRQGNVTVEDIHKPDDEKFIIRGAIPELDMKQGLSFWGGDMALYLTILRSFAENVPATLEKIRGVSMENINNYRISVHGLKGTSASIGAERISKSAAYLESLAQNGDLPSILFENNRFIHDTENLVSSIYEWLKQQDGGGGKPLFESPDPDILAGLRQSCDAYDIRGIDSAMAELENADYESGADLIKLLRKKIDVSEFLEAADIIKTYEETQTHESDA